MDTDIKLCDYLAIIKEPTVFFFTALWCSPCKSIKPAFNDLIIKYQNKFKMVMVDVDKNKDIANYEKITAMPTFIFYLGGQRLNEMTIKGANLKNLQTSLNLFDEKVEDFMEEVKNDKIEEVKNEVNNDNFNNDNFKNSILEDDDSENSDFSSDNFENDLKDLDESDESLESLEGN